VKAIELLETGGPEVLQLRETPIPTPGDSEVLIHIAASGVNFIDLYVREVAMAISHASFLGKRRPELSSLLARTSLISRKGTA
jgi:NADPH2:quinone reductase